MARLAAPENAPKMAEQMAVNADLTSRIPQKYLIQNQSGLRVYYWADEVTPVTFDACDARCSTSVKHCNWLNAVEMNPDESREVDVACAAPFWSMYVWQDQLHILQESGHPPRSCNLATGVSETLKVNPARRLLNIMMTGKHGGAKKVGNVINLHFEGNWMPIQVTFPEAS